MTLRKSVKCTKTTTAGLYLRVSTLSGQTTDNQERELLAAAKHHSLDIVQVYIDNGISGAKGRDKRPGLDAALKDAVRGKYDVLMAWSVDRLGRSLQGPCRYSSGAVELQSRLEA